MVYPEDRRTVFSMALAPLNCGTTQGIRHPKYFRMGIAATLECRDVRYLGGGSSGVTVPENVVSAVPSRNTVLRSTRRRVTAFQAGRDGFDSLRSLQATPPPLWVGTTRPAVRPCRSQAGRGFFYSRRLDDHYLL